jgi:hypothetical protein
MVSNQYCFGSAYKDGTQLYDISSPSSPSVVGYFDTYPQGGGNNNNWAGSAYAGNWSSYPFFPSRNVFALDMTNGIFMLRTHLYAQSDINVQGNSNDIVIGSISTSTSNNTNYGTVNIGNTLSKNFVIQNSGLATLTVNAIPVTGASASEFTLAGLPAFPFTVAPNTGTLGFSIVFTPTATGTRTAQITINNSDYNETNYDFVLEGDGHLLQTGIGSFENSDFRFFIYPNPIKNEAEFNTPAESIGKDLLVKIYDTNGKLILEKTKTEIQYKGNNIHKIVFNDLPSGLYTFSIFIDNKETASKKIVISK